MSERIQCLYFQRLPVADKQIDEHYLEVLACRKLWRALIDIMVEDILNPAKTSEDKDIQTAAQFWFKGGVMYDAKEEGFEAVCDLAGLNQHWVRQRINEFIVMGKPDAPVSV